MPAKFITGFEMAIETHNPPNHFSDFGANFLSQKKISRGKIHWINKKIIRPVFGKPEKTSKVNFSERPISQQEALAWSREKAELTAANIRAEKSWQQMDATLASTIRKMPYPPGTPPVEQPATPPAKLAALSNEKKKEAAFSARMQKEQLQFRTRFEKETTDLAKMTCTKFTQAAAKWCESIRRSDESYSREKPIYSDLINENREKNRNIFRNVLEKRMGAFQSSIVTTAPRLKTSKDLANIIHQRNKLIQLQDSLSKALSSPSENSLEYGALSLGIDPALEAFDKNFSEDLRVSMQHMLKKTRENFKQSLQHCITAERAEVTDVKNMIKKAEGHFSEISELHAKYINNIERKYDFNKYSPSIDKIKSIVNKSESDNKNEFIREIERATSSIYDRFEFLLSRKIEMDIHTSNPCDSFCINGDNAYSKLTRLTAAMNDASFIGKTSLNRNMPELTFQKIGKKITTAINISDVKEGSKVGVADQKRKEELTDRIFGKIKSALPNVSSRTAITAGAIFTSVGLVSLFLIPSANILAGLALVTIGILIISPFIAKKIKSIQHKLAGNEVQHEHSADKIKYMQTLHETIFAQKIAKLDSRAGSSL